MKKSGKRGILLFGLTIVLLMACLWTPALRKVNASGGGGGITIHHADACADLKPFEDSYTMGQGSGKFLSDIEHTFTAEVDEAFAEEYAGYPFTWRVVEISPDRTQTLISTDETGNMYQGDSFAFTPKAGYEYDFYVSKNNGVPVVGTYRAKAYKMVVTKLPGETGKRIWVKPGETVDFSDTQLWIYDAETIAEGGRAVPVKDLVSSLYDTGSSAYTISGFKATATGSAKNGAIRFWDQYSEEIYSDYSIYLYIAGTMLTPGSAAEGYYWYKPVQDMTVTYQTRNIASVYVYTKDDTRITAKLDSWEADAEGVRTYNYSVDLTGGVTYFFSLRDVDDESGSTISITLPEPQADPPKATSSFTAVNLSGGVKLTWKKVAGAAGYVISRKTGSGSYKPVTTIKKASTLTYTDTGAKTNGTKYTYKIVATSEAGDGKAKTVTHYFISKPVISSAKSTAEGKATVKWKKNAKATGYEVQFSLKSNFSTIAKKAVITKNSTVSKTQTGLKSKKKYYVRICTIKTVSGKKYYSAWSAKKAVTVK